MIKNSKKSSGSRTTGLSIKAENVLIPDNVIQNWQSIVNIFAKIYQVPVALIMKADPPYLDVFCSSDTRNNPYKVGDRKHWSGLYSEHVIRTKKDLLIYNALKDDQWDSSPNIKLGMVSYFGLPLLWPDREAFGTICILDSKENSYNTILGDLMVQIKGFIETQLELLWNLTEYKKWEEELINNENLTVLGKLTANLGHELCDRLASIKNAVYLLNLTLKDPVAEIKENLAILENDTETSENIIRNFLEYTQPKLLSFRMVDVNALLRITLSRIALPEKVELARQLDEKLPSILADPDQLTRTFRNIIFNAFHSMNDGGQLFIKTEIEYPRWILIFFTDTGVGIPEKSFQSLFDPLFTSKPKGIGLGLAITRSVIEAHGGLIEVLSELNKGSTIMVRLPLNVKEDD